MSTTEPEAGREMDDFDDVRRIYRQEAAGIEPSAALDAAILAASRRAVGAAPAPIAARRGGWRWQAPLAAAAVVVLATSLAVLFFDDGGRLPERDVPPPPRAAVPDAPPASGETASRPRIAARSEGANDRSAPSPVEAPERPRSDAPGTAVASAPPASPRAGIAAPESATPASASPEMAQGGNAAAADARQSAMASGPGEPRSRKAEALDRRDALASRDRTVEAEEAAAVRSQVQGAAPARAIPPAVSPPGTVVAGSPKGPVAGEAVAPSAPPAGEPSPQRRLEDIRRLWESGQREEATRRFEVFLRDQPGFPIPTDFPVPRPASR